MSSVVVDRTYLDDLADAIAEKAGVNTPLTLSEMESAINNISDGDGSSIKNDVIFYDYDGTILYDYSKAEFLALSTMPDNPTHTGLTSQGWNWTLADAKTYVTSYGMLDIGQIYSTNDGSSRFYITIDNDENTPEYDTPFKINFATSAAGNTTIDWGDNSTTTSTATTQTIYQHTYEENGNYVVKLTTSSGTHKFTSAVYGNSQKDRYNAARYKRIELGTTIAINNNWDNFENLINLESITIPPNIFTYVGRGSFRQCCSLKHLNIPSGVTYFGDSSGGGQGICQYDYSLESISLPKSVKTIPNSTFNECKSLKRITLPSSLTFLGASCFLHYEKLLYVTIPSGITIIYNNTFQYCYYIKEIVIPSGVTELGVAAFGNCTGLEKVTLPSTIVTLGNNVFDYCYSLKEINLSVTGITSMGSAVFRRCLNLLNIALPTTLTTISNLTFQQCEYTQTITGLNNVSSIGSGNVSNGGQFQYCYSIETINLPSMTTAVTNNMFDGCRRLKTLTIPSDVTVIGASAFSNCLSLIGIHFLSTSVPTLNNTNAFTNTNSCPIYVPYSADHSVLNAYKTATNWSTYASRIQEEPQS